MEKMGTIVEELNFIMKRWLSFLVPLFIMIEKYMEIKVFLKNSTIMWLLSQYSDINKSVWKIDNERLLLHLNNFRLAIVFLFTLKLNRLAYIINGYFKFVFKFPTMIKNMRSNRNKTSNWLNLE